MRSTGVQLHKAGIILATPLKRYQVVYRSKSGVLKLHSLASWFTLAAQSRGDSLRTALWLALSLYWDQTVIIITSIPLITLSLSPQKEIKQLRNSSSKNNWKWNDPHAILSVYDFSAVGHSLNHSERCLFFWSLVFRSSKETTHLK